VRSTWNLITVLGSLSLAACTFEEVETSTDHQELIGESMNGRSLNGRSLNGTNLGDAVKWVSASGAWLDGGLLTEVKLDGSQLVGEFWFGWGDVSGTEFEGALLVGRSDTGRYLLLRVADVIEPGASSSVWRYSIEFYFDGDWFPMCLADALTGEGLNGPLLNGDSLNDAIENGDIVVLPSIPLEGYWNYDEGVPWGGDKTDSANRFTFACTQIGAIGKCIEAGYEPWTSTEGVSLSAEHEACVRLLRADYCGDGKAHTINGVTVNVYDFAGVQDDTEAWGVEAEWNADGARCITANHRQAEPVACFDQLYDPTCGNPADWAGGTLVVSEIE
jgi:hypothetical protein